MTHEAMTLFERLENQRTALPIRGVLTLRLIDSASEPLVVHLSSGAHGVHAVTAPPAGEPDAIVETRWTDLLRLFRGEDNVQDLTETRRARVRGHRPLALAICQAMMDAMPGSDPSVRLDDRIRPFPGVHIHQSFAVHPFDPADPFSIPIVFNAFNRLTCLQQLVEYLRGRGYGNLYVVDNASTYPPLLDYYRTSGLRVFFLDQNVGCYALWRTAVQEQFLSSHYVLTDPDVLPIEGCPDDFVAFFVRLLDEHPAMDKVGFGLRIDDIPADVPFRHEILAIETLFWQNPIAADLYDAAIDTTFAVYRPGARGGHWLRAIRTGGRYQARHLSYYADPSHESDEDRYYQETSRKATHWTSKRAAYPFGLPSAR